MFAWMRFSPICISSVRNIVSTVQRKAFIQTSRCLAGEKRYAYLPVTFSKFQTRLYCERYEDIYEVHYDELISNLKKNEVMLIDVRERYEIETYGSFSSAAVNIPLGELRSALEMSPDKFKALYGIDLPDEDQSLVFVCSAGVRSFTALIQAKDLGFENSKHYPGGYIEWIEKTEPT